MKVVIVGSGEMLMALIAGCEDAGCKISGVLRAEKQQLSFIRLFLKDRLNPSKEYIYLKSHGLNELKSKSVNTEKFKKEILKYNADVILVGSWGEKFKQDIIDIPKLGTINVHPSLLPKYRGPNPYFWVIKNMEKTTGVTFHLMNAEYDAGEILSQKTLNIGCDITGKELKENLAKLARDGIKELLTDLDNDIVIPIEQNSKIATYYPHISHEECFIDFTKNSGEISAQIRALYPWGRAYFSHNSHYLSPNPYKIKIIDNEKQFEKGKVYEVNAEKRIISVVCGDGKVLQMEDVRIFGILRIITDLYIKFRVKVGSSLI